MGEGKPKVVVIVGALGVGKSRLAIDLAQQFPAEIVNADSMQVSIFYSIHFNSLLVPPSSCRSYSNAILAGL